MNKTESNRLCIFVQVYNEYELLDNLIQSLKEQTHIPDRLIIIDDGSPETKVLNEIERLSQEYPSLNIHPLGLPLKEKPDLDTVGVGLKKAWISIKDRGFEYVSILDADAGLAPDYYKVIITALGNNLDLGCASGALIVKTEEREYLEDINIGAKVGRKDARGTGKVIRASLLHDIELEIFPDITWDTWINTKAKLKGLKSPQINETYFYTSRPTTRVMKKDLFRNGRLSYHFGYNPILVLMKIILAGTGGLKILKGYRSARKASWKLKDSDVRSYFGWKFFLHF